MTQLTVNVIGAGAVGHLWACFLKRSGCHVSLYVRSPRESQRININSPTGNFSCDINYLTLNQWKKADVTLICVKAFQLRELCKTLSQYKNNPTILMMNGMGLVEIASNALPNTPIFQASLVQGALLDDTLSSTSNNTTLTHTGNGTTYIGSLSTSERKYNVEKDGVEKRSVEKSSVEKNNCAKIQSIITHLNNALPNVAWKNEHQQIMLLKLCINAVINPVTALKKINNGEIIIKGKLDSLAQKLLQELSPLIEELLPSYSLQDVQQKIIAVAKSTANNRSSMLRDVELGRKTEIDFINGHLIRLAQERSIEMSEHYKILLAIHRLST